MKMGMGREMKKKRKNSQRGRDDVEKRGRGNVENACREHAGR
jgi:hypothetical protein